MTKQLKSVERALHVVNSVYNLYSLTVLNDVYAEFNHLYVYELEAPRA